MLAELHLASVASDQDHQEQALHAFHDAHACFLSTPAAQPELYLWHVHPLSIAKNTNHICCVQALHAFRDARASFLPAQGWTSGMCNPSFSKKH